MRGPQKYAVCSPTCQAADAKPTRAHPRGTPCRRSRPAQPATSIHTITCGWTDLRGSGHGVIGVARTAIPCTLWVEGTRGVRVEKVTILGYVEPAAGPLYAVFLVGQLPSVWTVIGGALILGAGLLVVVFSRSGGEASVAVASEPEPL